MSVTPSLRNANIKRHLSPLSLVLHYKTCSSKFTYKYATRVENWNKESYLITRRITPRLCYKFFVAWTAPRSNLNQHGRGSARCDPCAASSRDTYSIFLLESYTATSEVFSTEWFARASLKTRASKRPIVLIFIKPVAASAPRRYQKSFKMAPWELGWTTRSNISLPTEASGTRKFGAGPQLGWFTRQVFRRAKTTGRGFQVNHWHSIHPVIVLRSSTAPPRVGIKASGILSVRSVLILRVISVSFQTRRHVCARARGRDSFRAVNSLAGGHLSYR